MESYLDFMRPADRQRTEEALQVSTPAPAQTETYLDYMPAAMRRQITPDVAASHRQFAAARNPHVEDIGSFLERRAIPFVSMANNFVDDNEYAQAKNRVATGGWTQQDKDVVATYENRQRTNQERGIVGNIASSLAHVPALVGETLVGGAVLGRIAPGLSQAAPLFSRAAIASPSSFGMAAARTGALTALIPSMYAPGIGERAAATGTAAYEPQNILPALAMGFAQTAVLGSLGEIANNISGTGAVSFAKRLAARTFGGMAEQQGIDAIAGAIDNILPEAYQTNTRYGLMGNALRGEWGELGKHFASQVVTFAAFAALHPILHGERQPEQPGAQQQSAPPEPGAMPAVGPMGQPLGPREPGVTPATPSRPELGQGMPRPGMPRPQEVFQAATDALNGMGTQLNREAVMKRLVAIGDKISAASMSGDPKALADVGKEVAKLKGHEREYAEKFLKMVQEPWADQTGTPLHPEDAARFRAQIEEQSGQRGTGEPVQKVTPEAPLQAQPPETAPGAQTSTPEQIPTERPPEAQTGQTKRFAMALRTEDGQVHFDPSAKHHAEVMVNQRVNPDLVKDTGFVDMRNGQYHAGNPEFDAKGVMVGVEPYKPVSSWMGELGKAGEGVTPYEKKLVEQARVQNPIPEPVPAVEQRTIARPSDQPLTGDVSPAEAAAWNRRVNPSRAHFGDREISQEWRDRIENSNLTPHEKKLMESLMSGASTHVMEDSGQFIHPKSNKPYSEKPMSDTTLDAHMQKALEKLKRENPKGLEHIDTVADVRTDHAIADAEKALEYAGKLKERGAVYSQAEGSNVGEKGGMQATGGNSESVRYNILDQVIQSHDETLQHYAALQQQQLELADVKLSVIGRKLGKSEAGVQRDIGSATKDSVSPSTAQEPTSPTPGPESAGYKPNPADARLNEKVEKIAESATAIIHGRNKRRGELNLPTSESAKEFGKKLLGTYERFNDELATLASKTYVGMTRLSRSLGEAASRYAAHSVWVADAIPDKLESLYGPKPDAENNVRNATGIGEVSRRHAIQNKLRLAQEATSKGKANEAEKHRAAAKEMTSFVGNEGSPFKTEADFQTWKGSDEGKRFLAEWKDRLSGDMKDLYAQYKDILPEDISFQNQHPDYPFNFLRKTEAQLAGEEAKAKRPGTRTGDLGNLRSKKLIYDQMGERALPWEAYDWNLENIVSASLGGLAERAGRAVYNRELLASGLAQDKPGPLPNGDKTWEYPSAMGPAKPLYVSERIEKEVRQSLGLEHKPNVPFLTDAANLINKANITLPLQELSAHLKNQFTSAFAEGVIPFYDHVRRAIDYFKGDQGFKDKALELAKIGAGRPKGLETGQFWGGNTDPTSWGAKLLKMADTVSRVVLSDAHDRNVAMGRIADTETNRRDFTNMNMGNYNARSQHRLIAWIKALGLNPFAVANMTFNLQGLRAAGIGPGIEATSTAHAIGLRAERVGKAALVLGTAFALNKLMWGSPFGDDDTPFGAIKLGTTQDGKSVSMDLSNFTGLTRGMRETGLLALTEGIRHEQPASRIADRASEGIYQALLQTFEGPAVGFAHTAITGKDVLGREITRENNPSGSHTWENLRAAGIQANPVANAFFAAERHGRERDMTEKALGLAGPFGPKFMSENVVGNFKATLAELEEAKKAWVQGDGRNGMAFPQERQLRILQAFSTHIQQYEHALRGDRRAPGGAFLPGEKPEASTQATYRSQMERMARMALERVRGN